MLGRLAWIALIVAGCDARASEDYRGEPLYSVTGTLVVDSEHDWSDLEPVIVFLDPDLERPRPILDVDTRGEFPAKFTLDLMQPPPAAAMQRVQGMPSFAIGAITALPRDHRTEWVRPDSEFPTAESSYFTQDGVSYLRRHSCLADDQCYEELRQCSDELDEVCSTIIEQEGDPAIQARVDEIFAARRPPETAYLVIYVAQDGPLDETRGYLPHRYAAYLSDLFGKGPMTAGYHLAQWRDHWSEDELPALERCQSEASDAAAMRLGTLHGQDFENYLDLFVFLLMETSGKPYDHPYYQTYAALFEEETFERRCMASGIRVLDPTKDNFEITLDHDDLNLY